MELTINEIVALILIAAFVIMKLILYAARRIMDTSYPGLKDVAPPDHNWTEPDCGDCPIHGSHDGECPRC